MPYCAPEDVRRWRFTASDDGPAAPGPDPVRCGPTPGVMGAWPVVVLARGRVPAAAASFGPALDLRAAATVPEARLLGTVYER
jgi:hypothetical protein